jgi:hypothetical protein
MRFGVLVLLILVNTATAQPALAPTLPLPQVPTPEEREILATGEISTGAHVGGVVGSLFLAFGSGQAIQGRWSDTGWIFTVGEVASIVALVYGINRSYAGDCLEDPCHRNHAASDLALGGLIAFMVLHTWEIGDAIIVPSLHNQRYHEIAGRYGYARPLALRPYVAPHGDGAVAGLSLQF